MNIVLGGILLYRVVVIGGGWSGCAAALSARKAGADVVLLEKTDLLHEKNVLSPTRDMQKKRDCRTIC